MRLAAISLLLTDSARAQQQPLSQAQQQPIGNTAWALPGIIRVGVAAAGSKRVAGAGSAGYGYTESLVPGVSAHHRLDGAVAAGYVPAAWAALGLRLDGRYDWHPGGEETDRGLTGDPRLLLRAGTVAAGQLHLGAEARVLVPGGDAPSIVFDATTVAAQLLAAWHGPGSGLTVASAAGFRLDNSANAIEDPARYSAADRVALGLSEFHAVLLGLGLGYRIGSTELLGEVTADVLVGSGAPPVKRSPLRISLGLRQHLSDSLQLQLTTNTSLSGQPGTAPTDDLVPIEPRFSGLVGLCYQYSLGPPPAPAP